MRNRFAVRGPSVGPCAICGVVGPLSEDHVPPKGASRLKNIEMGELWHRLQVDRSMGDQQPRPPQFSQNGVKFKSICVTCNNVRLGAECDPALISFAKDVGALLTHLQASTLALPGTLPVRAKPTTILRGIVGHILALNVGKAPAGEMDEALADYFLHPNHPLHQAADCFYWLYPFNDQVMVPGAVLGSMLGSGGSHTFFKLLKFYPFAFMLTWKHEGQALSPLQNLADHRRVPLGTEIDIPIATGRPPHQFWPEAPTNHSVVLYGAGPTTARPREPRP